MRHLVSILRTTVSGAIEHRAYDSAAAIAYFTLFATFPLLLGLVAASSLFLDSAEAQERILEIVAEAFPGAAAAARDNIATLIRLRGAMGVVSVIGLLWSATAGVSAISRAINSAWGHEDQAESAWARSAQSAIASWRRLPATVRTALISAVDLTRSFALTLAIATLLIGVLAVLPLLDLLASLEIGILGPLQSAWSPAFDYLANWLYLLAFFALIYRLVPYMPPPRGATFPGALLAATALLIAKIAFRYYVASAADYEAVYGTLASGIVMLLWLYWRALVLILGVEFNVALARERESPGITAAGR